MTEAELWRTCKKARQPVESFNQAVENQTEQIKTTNNYYLVVARISKDRVVLTAECANKRVGGASSLPGKK